MKKLLMRYVAGMCVASLVCSGSLVYAQEPTDVVVQAQTEESQVNTEAVISETEMTDEMTETLPNESSIVEESQSEEASDIDSMPDEVIEEEKVSETDNLNKGETTAEEVDKNEPEADPEYNGVSDLPDEEDIRDTTVEAEGTLNTETSDDVLSEEAEEELPLELEAAEEDDDPQRGTAMSGAEEEKEASVPSLFSLSRSSSYTGSTYTHNSRYDSGYKIVNGIDVSYYNGTINWNAVKAAGIEYAIIRVGYRGYGSAGTLNEDPKFEENIRGALSAGLKVGVYIFSQAISQSEAAEEADFVLDRISKYNITLPVVIDYEYASGNIGRLYNANLSVSKATAVCKAFCRVIEEEGYTAMVYANKSMLENNLNANELSSRYKVWLANYTTQTSYSGDYYAWQYSSKGQVSGISGYVDCNFFYEKEDTPASDLTGARSYVQRLYEVLLGRSADESGLAANTNAMASGSLTASDVAVSIITSAEFENKNYSDQTYVSKLYQALLGRAAGTSEISGWVEKMATGVSRRYPLIQLVNSSEFTNVCNRLGIIKGSVQLTENRDRNCEITAYVARCYKYILGRTADVSGLNAWTGKILSGYGGAEIVKDLVVSPEFANRKKSDSEFLDIIYNTMLERNADAAGKQSWLDCLGEGVSYVYIINGFAGSKEFTALCNQYGIVAGSAAITEARDKNIGVTGFVTRTYKTVLGRNADVAGLNNWCNAILSKAQTPAQVAYGFVFSQECLSKNLSNADFVEMLYGTCLGRKSDAPGKKNWVDSLNAGATREGVFWGFGNSEEFQAIIRGYGL